MRCEEGTTSRKVMLTLWKRRGFPPRSRIDVCVEVLIRTEAVGLLLDAAGWVQRKDAAVVHAGDTAAVE